MTRRYAAIIDDERQDLDLVRSARAGGRDALETLLRRHHDRIHGLCRRIAGNEADAQDATQEALIAIVRGLPTFDGVSRFSTWAFRVATNACLDELRRRRRRPLPGLDIDVDVAARDSDIGDAVGLRLDIDAAMARVPEEFRVAVTLRDLLGLDYAEIATVLGVPPGTVRSRIARGRRALAGLLTGNSASVGERPTA
jgi:RNA polymerase sigma-70 factor, ECF subfamily